MSEIISLQFGDYANFVGSHYWNLEDELAVLDDDDREVDRATVFRTSENQKGRVVSAPRVVTFGLAGESGTISGLGSLHPDAKLSAEDVVMTDLWDGPSTTVQRPPVQKNRFLSAMDDADAQLDGEEDGMDWGDQRRQSNRDSVMDLEEEEDSSGQWSSLEGKEDGRQRTQQQQVRQQEVEKEQGGELFEENTVKYWSDFSRLNFHEKSMSHVRGVYDQKEDFKRFTQGPGLLSRESEDFEEMTDRMRFFAEECDTLQGVQVLSEYDSGFGGLTVQYLESIRDDYGEKLPIYANLVDQSSIMKAAFMEQKSQHKLDATINVANATHAVVHLSELCTTLGALSTAHFADKNKAHALARRLKGLDQSSKYQSSALLAQVLQSAAMPFRSISSGTSMRSFLGMLTPEPSKKIVAYSSAFPVHVHDAVFADKRVKNASSRAPSTFSPSSSFSSSLLPSTCLTKAPHDIVAREAAKRHARTRDADGNNDDDDDVDQFGDESAPAKVSGESTVLRGRLLLHAQDTHGKFDARMFAPMHFRERVVYGATPQVCGSPNMMTSVFDQPICLAYPFPTQTFATALPEENRAASVTQTTCGGDFLLEELRVLQAHFTKYSKRLMVPFAQDDFDRGEWAVLADDLANITGAYAATARDMY
jgi:hypothetical protein